MRRRLILVFVATSTLVALAFVVPLAALVQRTVSDRAVAAARAESAAVVPALVSADSAVDLESTIVQTRSGAEGRMTMLTADGQEIGAPIVARSPLLDRAMHDGLSGIGEIDGGIEVVTVVASGTNELSAIRVFVPRSMLWDGVFRAWAILAAVGLVLVAISVLVADRLARSIVRPTQQLAVAAQQLGQGELGTRVRPSGPEELVELGETFNNLGGQVSKMLAREREMVADLSHRLRTPLTKLRLRADQVSDGELGAELQSDIDDLTGVVSDVIHEARGALRQDGHCDAAAVVAERAEFWRALAEDQRRSMQTLISDVSLPVAVSPVELAAVVDNLIDNVFSHTPDEAEFVVGCEHVAQTARIWVADSGSGFPDDMDLAGRGRSGHGSTGLGLDIAVQLVADADGELTVGSSGSGGALVTLVLPLAVAQ